MRKNKENLNRILIIQLARTGDIAMSLPAIEGLRSKHPDAEICVLSRTKFKNILNNHPAVDTVYEFKTADYIGAFLENQDESSFMDNLEKSIENLDSLLRDTGKFDLAIDLTFSETSTYVLSQIKTNRRRGLSRDKKGFLDIKDDWSRYLFSVVQTQNLNRFHVSDLFRMIAGVAEEEPNSQLECQEEARETINHVIEDHAKRFDYDGNDKKWISFQLGASRQEKMWDARGFIETIEALIDLDPNYHFFLLGSINEGLQIGNAITEKFPNRVINLCGKTTDDEYFAAISRSSVVLSGDSSGAHFASQANVPNVMMMFAGGRPHETCAYGSNHLVIQPVQASKQKFITTLRELELVRRSLPAGIVAESINYLISGNDLSKIEKHFWNEGLARASSKIYLWKTNLVQRDNKEWELELQSLIDRFPSMDDCMRDILYLIAKFRIDQKIDTVSELDLRGQDVAPQIEKAISGLEMMYRTAEFGVQYSALLKQAVMEDNRDEIYRLGDKLAEIDELFRELKAPYPYFAGFIEFYEAKRTGTPGLELYDLSKETHLVFQEMVEDLQIIFQLIQQSVTATQKQLDKAEKVSNSKPKKQKEIEA